MCFSLTDSLASQSYLDFHSELFPPVQDYQNPAQDSKAWLDGEDSPPALVTPQPGKIWGGAATQQKTKKVEDSNSIAIDRAKVQTAASTSGALGTPELASVQNSTALSGPGTGHKASTTVNTAPSKQMSEVKITESKVSHDSPSSATTNAPTASAKPATETSTSTRGVDISARTEVATSSISSIQQPATTVPKPQSTSHTHWSRSFLAGKTHLKPEYEDVHNISNTIRASVQLLKANMKYLFYPLSGPGGRLGYHPVEKKGRLPVQIPCITSGHDIVDFDLDPFKDEKVFIAGSDGKIRVFEVKEEGESTDQLLSEASINLDGKAFPHFNMSQ